MIPEKLKENEYLLKIRPSDNCGFMTKYNKNGTMPKAFDEWSEWQAGFGYATIPIQLHIEEFRRGWKFISYRVGESQSWAKVQHPDGFTLEIYLNNLMEIVEKNKIVNGEIIGKYKWNNKKLINVLSELSQERNNKIKNLEKEITIENLNDEILKTENSILIELWNKYTNILNEHI